jgi:CRP-like cAMP-binding protein
MENSLSVLSFSPLFAGITHEEVQRMLNGVHYQIKQFKTNDVIVCHGDECKSLQMVIEGNVRGEMMDATGRVLKIEDIGVPRPLAIAFLFGQNNRYPVTITANENSTLLILPRASVIKLIQSSEVFLTNFMNVISNRAQFITDKLKFHSFQNLRGKLADYFLELDRSNNGVIYLTKTHEELGEMFGVARPSLSRTLRELHNEGLINAEGKRIEIIDRNGLMKCVGK